MSSNNENKLNKIRDVSNQYNISARTLRYYEDIGLLSSIRNDDYAYRLYDEEAIKKLQQILMLRKLNISIKDIKKIFEASNSKILLQILDKKINDIDGEIILWQELKTIILEFISQIKKYDFNKNSDITLLYERAKDIEYKLTIDHFYDVTDKLKKAPEVRIVKINKFRAITSGADTFANIFSENGYNQWQEAHNHLIKNLIYASPDFMWFEEDKCTWIWAIEDWVTLKDTAPYDIIEFEGGLYAAAMSIDGDDDVNGRVYMGIKKWIETSGFELDERKGHRTLCHMVNPSNEIKKALGYHQLDIYVPIKIKE